MYNRSSTQGVTFYGIFLLSGFTFLMIFYSSIDENIEKHYRFSISCFDKYRRSRNSQLIHVVINVLCFSYCFISFSILSRRFRTVAHISLFYSRALVSSVRRNERQHLKGKSRVNLNAISMFKKIKTAQKSFREVFLPSQNYFVLNSQQL